eukprot:403349821
MSSIGTSNDGMSKLKELSHAVSKLGLDVEKTLDTSINVKYNILTLVSNTKHLTMKCQIFLQVISFQLIETIILIVLYEYTNKEYELVAACFRAGNCFNLRDLPDLIGPNNVLQALKEKLEKAAALSQMNAKNKEKYSQLGKASDGVLFQKFDWVPDQYNAFTEQLKKEHEERKQKQDNLHKVPFNPAKIKRKIKHEYPFLARDESYTYSFLLQDDPYDATKDEILRTKWMDEARQLFGDFKPSGPQKPLSDVSKSRMQDIVETLKKLLLSDWNDVNFVIGTPPWVRVVVVSYQNFKNNLLQNDVINQSKSYTDKTSQIKKIGETSISNVQVKKPTLYSRDININ